MREKCFLSAGFLLTTEAKLNFMRLSHSLTLMETLARVSVLPTILDYLRLALGNFDQKESTLQEDYFSAIVEIAKVVGRSFSKSKAFQETVLAKVLKWNKSNQFCEVIRPLYSIPAAGKTIDVS